MTPRARGSVDNLTSRVPTGSGAAAGLMVIGSDCALTGVAPAREAVTSKTTSDPTSSAVGWYDAPVPTSTPSASQRRAKDRSLPSGAPVLVQAPSWPVRTSS